MGQRSSDPMFMFEEVNEGHGNGRLVFKRPEDYRKQVERHNRRQQQQGDTSQHQQQQQQQQDGAARPLKVRADANGPAVTPTLGGGKQ